jgi:phosphate transport system ATP-binding protein
VSAQTEIYDLIAPQGPPVSSAADLRAREISAWFGWNKVLDRVSLDMPARTVTALIGPSGCGKSTFLRILNRMHESVPSAKLAGEVLLNGDDIYAPGHRITETRRRIGMVFQKPNPFPAMTIADNVTAGLKLTGRRVSRSDRADLIERCLTRGGLWNHRHRHAQHATSGSGITAVCVLPCCSRHSRPDRRVGNNRADLREPS